LEDGEWKSKYKWNEVIKDKTHITVYPNPANESLKVSISPEAEQPKNVTTAAEGSQTSLPVGFGVKRYNASQKVVYEGNSKASEIDISVKHLPEGFYTLHVTEKGTITRKHIIINH
jgi:predicted cupin superfamily sugar epimerase